LFFCFISLLEKTVGPILRHEKLVFSTRETTVSPAGRALHQQLDDDNDGTIEPSETGDFIKGDLKVRTEIVSECCSLPVGGYGFKHAFNFASSMRDCAGLVKNYS
jgi:hypothetical protein